MRAALVFIACHARLVVHVRAACNATEQVAILESEARRLVQLIESDVEPAACTGISSATCVVSDPKARKGCMDRTCAKGHTLLSREALAALHHDKAENHLTDINKRLVNPVVPKLRIGPTAFVAGEYFDFLVYSLLFPGFRGGTFVEAGGGNGIIDSNTWAFEQYLGWTGILVEPTVCAPCNLVYNRPASTAIHNAICPPGMPPTATFHDKVMDGMCQKMNNESLSESADLREPNQACLQKALHESKPVPCRTLTTMFQEQKKTRIDFFSLDVEKHVDKALAGLDFKAIDVSALLVEVWRIGEVHTLHRHGYVGFFLTSNADKRRGYLGDYLAWKPERWTAICDASASARYAPT